VPADDWISSDSIAMSVGPALSLLPPRSGVDVGLIAASRCSNSRDLDSPPVRSAAALDDQRLHASPRQDGRFRPGNANVFGQHHRAPGPRPTPEPGRFAAGACFPESSTTAEHVVTTLLLMLGNY
jgi:hypothetical protein